MNNSYQQFFIAKAFWTPRYGVWFSILEGVVKKRNCWSKVGKRKKWIGLW